MHLLMEATHAMGAVLLQIAVALLFEELSFGGLVRLILAPRPAGESNTEPENGNEHQGETPCSH
jgi:hypothetical protein